MSREGLQKTEGMRKSTCNYLGRLHGHGPFPREEVCGLTSQIRRAAASMGANIAEGCGKQGNRELYRFLQMDSSSASELDYHFLLAKYLKYLAEGDFRRLETELFEFRKM